MRKSATKRPETTEQQANGTTTFNFDVVKIANKKYEHSSIDVAGEFTRANITHAFMLEHYSQEEIDRINSVTSQSESAMDVLKMQSFNALQAEINGWIDNELGISF